MLRHLRYPHKPDLCVLGYSNRLRLLNQSLVYSETSWLSLVIDTNVILPSSVSLR